MVFIFNLPINSVPSSDICVHEENLHFGLSDFSYLFCELAQGYTTDIFSILYM